MPATLYLITPLIALVASGLVIAVIRFLDVLEREPWWAIGLSFVIGLMTVIPAILIGSFTTMFWRALLGESAPLAMLQVTVESPDVQPEAAASADTSAETDAGELALPGADS